MGRENKTEKVIKEVGKSAKKIEKKYGRTGLIICILLSVSLLVFSGLFMKKMIGVGVHSAITSFHNSYEDAKDTAHDDYFEKGRKKGYEKYRQRQNTSIALGEIREVSKLEVLNVISEDYVIQNDALKAKGIYWWGKYRGTGVFTVNLQASEFIVDDAAHYVLVRVPKPELTEFKLNKEKTERILYADNSMEVPVLKWTFNDGSYDEGVAIAIDQTREAYSKIRNKISSEQRYYSNAEASATQQIQNLIKALNGESFSDLEVDVEFY